MVLCRMSYPQISDEVGLGDLLSKALPDLKYEGILEISFDSALIWVPKPALQSLLRAGCIELNDRSTASFSLAQNAASCFLELTLSNPAYLAQLSMAVHEMDDTAYLSQRNSGVLIKLLTPSASAELFCNLKTYFSPEKGIENIRHIPLAEHSFINCHIKLGDQGAISFDTPATVLKLRNLIQSALDKHVEQPFVLDVQYASKMGSKNTETTSNRSDQKDMEELLLFCPRMSDIEALKAIGVIELSDGSSVQILSSTSTSTPQPLEFPLTLGSSASSTSTPTSTATAPNLSYPYDKIAILLHIETKNPASDLYHQQEDEQMEECLRGHSASLVPMALDEYYATEDHYSPQERSMMNMNMNMNDSLRMTLSTCSTDARLHTMDFENDTVFPGMESTGMSRQGQAHDIRTSHVLEIDSYVIANHFKSLIRWTAELDRVSSSNEAVFPFVLNLGNDVRETFTLQTDIGLSTISWGETIHNATNNKHHNVLNSRDSNQEEDGGLLDQGVSAVTLLIDTRLKSYTLTIYAPSTFELEFRVAGCAALVKTLAEMSHRMTLTGWLPQHREAINQSDELRGVEDLTRSTVLYHNNKEKVISADVLSVNTAQQADMMTYLSSLKPTQVDWTVPYQYISDYDIQRWNEIQKKFAIRVNAKWKEMPHRADPDWAMQQRTKKELRVWAFNNFADKALQYISATRYQAYPSGGSVDSNSDSDMQDSMEKSPVDFDMKGGMQGPGPAWINASHMQTLSRSQDYSDDNYVEDFFDESDKSANNPSTKKFRCQFAFHDRESGMFYTAFEAEFQAYLWQTYGARIAIMETNANWSGKPAGAPPVNSAVRRAPLLRLEFTCFSRTELTQVKNYFEKFANFNFPRQQIHYPRCNGMWLKEISAQKEKNELSLRALRTEAAALGAQRKGGDRALDPLLTPGYLHIRLKPPLHSRGIRRMTLPTNLTITICGPLNTDAQRDGYNTTFDELAALDCHYVTASVQIPLKAPIGRIIAVRASREEFIAAYGLVSIKWEENNQKKAIDNAGFFDDTCSTGSDTSNPSSNTKPQSEDQLGVAKIWAQKTETMKIVLSYLCSKGGGVLTTSNLNPVAELPENDSMSSTDLIRKHLGPNAIKMHPSLHPSQPPLSRVSSMDSGVLHSVFSEGSTGCDSSSSYSLGEARKVPLRRNSVPPGYAFNPPTPLQGPYSHFPLDLSGDSPHRKNSYDSETGRFSPASNEYESNSYNHMQSHLNTVQAPHQMSRQNSATYGNCNLSTHTNSNYTSYASSSTTSNVNSSFNSYPSSPGLSSKEPHSYCPSITTDWEKSVQKIATGPVINQREPYQYPIEAQERARSSLSDLRTSPVQYANLSTSSSPTSAFSPMGPGPVPMNGRLTRDIRGTIIPGPALSGAPGGPGNAPFGVYRDPGPYGVVRADPVNQGALKRYPPNVQGYTNNTYEIHPTAQVPPTPPTITNQFIECRSLVHWPHPSFRFMFLGDPLKHQLSELLHKYRVRGVGITTPFRDKCNPTACLSIEGTNEGVAAATAHVNTYFRSVTFLMRNVSIVLTAVQREKLTSSDLTRVKEIQGGAGVHILLDPLSEDLKDSISSFDFRLPLTDNTHQKSVYPAARNGPAGGYPRLPDPSNEAVPLIAVRVFGLSGRGTDVSVVTTGPRGSLGEGCATWGVSSLLLFVNANTLSSFSPRDRDSLLRGEAIIDEDHLTGNVVIRVLPKSRDDDESSECSDRGSSSYDKNDQSANAYNSVTHASKSNIETDQQTALVRAVSEGLAAADNLQLTGLAVTCPLGNRALNHLSETLIRTLTVEAMVSFLRSITQTSLKRVVCIDITEEDNTPPPDAYNTGAGTPQANSTGTASPQNADALLFPACGNRMAGTLLLLLEQEVLFVRKAEQQREIELQARHSDPFSMLSSRDSYSQPFEPTIQLIACNMPLPNSIPGHTIYPILKAKRNPFGFNGCGGYESPYHRSMNDTAHYSQSHQQQQQQQQLQQQQQHTQQGAEYRQNEQCVLMVRGLSVCILRAIKSIKAIVAVPLSPQLPDSIQRHVYY